MIARDLNLNTVDSKSMPLDLKMYLLIGVNYLIIITKIIFKTFVNISSRKKKRTLFVPISLEAVMGMPPIVTTYKRER